MATQPLGGKPLPFNIPTGLCAVQAIDAEFWRLHAQWQLLEDEFETHPGFPDQCPESAALLDRATAARDAMFGRGVWTGTALFAKLAACRAGGAGSLMEQDLQAGITVFDVIQWDCERIMKRDLGLWEPSLALC